MSAGVLLVTADAALSAAVPRLCALAGVGCEVDRDSAGARAAWRYVGAILVGSDVAPALAAFGLPRRDRVVVLASGPVDTAGWQAAIALGATAVLQLPGQEAALIESLRPGPAASAPTARVIAVMGGSGGAGASTLAAALAITAARSGTAMLFDGDPLGGGLDVLLGAESMPGLRWNELAATRGQLDPATFASAICSVADIGLLSWGRPALGASVDLDAVVEVLAAATRSYATVVVDTARSPGRVTEHLLEAADATVVVVPADVRSVAAAAALAAMFGRRLGSPNLVVRDPGGSGLAAKDVAASLGMPLVATLRSEATVQAAAHRGEPPVRRNRCALTQVCEALLAAIAEGDPR